MRYTPFSYVQRYGIRLQRLVLDGGFTCPNRDGTVGIGGCTFCDNAAFHPAYTKGKSISAQIDEGIAFNARRLRRADGFLAYFQAFSGTYAPLEVLRARYEEALAHPGVRGIVIGTRPDCVEEEKLDYLADIMRRGYIVEVEYGIESVYDRTLERVNRGHDFACTVEAVGKTAERGIPVGGHIIIGMPGESMDDIVGEADILNALPLSSLKIHQLQILKGTAMETEFRHGREDFLRLGPDEYVELLVCFLERLRADIAVGRIVSSVPPSFTDAPWGLLKQEELLKRLDGLMEKRNTCQGRLCAVKG